MAYDNYFKRLEIAKLPTVAERRAALIAAGLTNVEPTIADEGYYRKPLSGRGPNGQTIIRDYLPVALFINPDNPDELVGVVGDKEAAHDATPEEIVDLWTWISNHPVVYEVFRAVVEDDKPWPDLRTTDTALLYAEASGHPQPPRNDLPPTERVIDRGHNEPPELLPEVEAAQAIDTAIAAADTTNLKISNEAEASVALGSSNRIRELRLATEKLAKQRVEPLQRAYETERAKWLPLVQRAKAAESVINAAYLAYRDAERKRIDAEQAEAKRKQAELDEQNERAAQRAISRGEPERAPETHEQAPAASIGNPSPPVRPAYGNRKAPKEVARWHFDEIENFDATLAYFKDTDELRALIGVLALAAVKGGREVPGVKRHWGLV